MNVPDPSGSSMTAAASRATCAVGTEQAARESVDASGAWKGELVFTDVPVTILPGKKP